MRQTIVESLNRERERERGREGRENRKGANSRRRNKIRTVYRSERA